MNKPSLVVISSLFPSSRQPGVGLFIRERMFRVSKQLPITVVSPQAWFPGQFVLSKVFPLYRVLRDTFEIQSGIEVYRPRALSCPGIGRRFDGFAMAVAALPIVRRLKQSGRCDIIDAHFAYPDGYAASLLGKWLKLPVCITLRGTELRHLAQPALRSRLLQGLHSATRIFSVSESLRQLVIQAGVPADKIEVVGNGVDTELFSPIDRKSARAQLKIPQDAKVLITVGALVERKGFHRVIEQLPRLLPTYPNLIYLVVGGPSPEGDRSKELRRQVEVAGLSANVQFLGPLKPYELPIPLSAADVAVLASSNEGWANVILEAMACGCPVIASSVGGNAEVVCNRTLGAIYEFGNDEALYEKLASALAKEWDARALIDYAARNSWGGRVEHLVSAFRSLGGHVVTRTIRHA